ncbi:hypothetical protein KFK09_008607 [Dendrobium nobile]|uniref:FAR1 domain-containing protein n=1 Tax=Dendrobium nobile TaxID=94219 RepID=A0A8T3BPZ4_DENNO|nr:hypothetical protein KFK09_008607 [Dendrobium nobile]
MDYSAKREVEEGMEEGVHESERMYESKGLVHESESEPNLAGNSSGFNISAVYKDETEAYECFCTYAHDNGFSVRKDHHSFWPNSRKIKSKDFVCSKAGFKKSDYHTSGKRKRFTRPVVRTGYPAMVRFVTDEDGYWHVKRFIESHNHELVTPADRHLLRSCRNIIEEKASILKSMTDAGIRTGDAYAYLAEEVGGCENVGFSKRDAYNFIQKEKRARIEIGDTNSLIQLFKDRQVEDHMFAWDEEFIKAVGEMSIDFVSTDSSRFLVNYIEKKNQNHPWVVHFDATEGGKKRNEKDVASSQGGTANLKDPLKRRPKGISNARLKSHWEKKKRPKSRDSTIILLTEITSLIFFFKYGTIFFDELSSFSSSSLFLFGDELSFGGGTSLADGGGGGTSCIGGSGRSSLANGGGGGIGGCGSSLANGGCGGIGCCGRSSLAIGGGGGIGCCGRSSLAIGGGGGRTCIGACPEVCKVVFFTDWKLEAELAICGFS